jgi:hypothetical protein
MSSSKKKRVANEEHVHDELAYSSYAQLKKKCLLYNDECERVCNESYELRREKELLETELVAVRSALVAAQRNNVEVVGLLGKFLKQKEEEKSTTEAHGISLIEENKN